MPNLKILLKPEERDALNRLAEYELRDPRAQASLIIRHELERMHLLESKTPPDVGNNGGDKAKAD